MSAETSTSRNTQANSRANTAASTQALFANVPANRNAQRLSSSVKLKIKIDRITLHQYTRAERGRFTRALSRELTRLAQSHAESDWGSAGAGLASSEPINIDRLDAGQLRPGASAEEAARRIAQNIFASVRPRFGNTKGDHA